MDMVEDTKNEIITENFHQKVVGPTHFWPGKVDSLIDQSWSNKPDSVIECRNIVRARADHNLIQTLVRIKGNGGGEHEIVKRNRRSLDIEDYREQV